MENRHLKASLAQIFGLVDRANTRNNVPFKREAVAMYLDGRYLEKIIQSYVYTR